MSTRPRPHRQASFELASLLVLSLCTSACLEAPPPSDAGKKAAAGNKAESPAPGDESKGRKAATTKLRETPPADAPAADGCSLYCLEGKPCGDACVAADASCDKPAGTACEASKRKVPTYAKGQMVRSLIAADVPVYNAAQGDPIAGAFTLDMAFEGAPELADVTKGELTAIFDTSMGTIECKLFEDKAPLTVANFVGLARGVRPFLDPKDRNATEWKKAPYYDNTTFHRVIEGFMIQGGDPTGSGTGTPGYFIPDEFHASLRHSGAGILSMANRNQVDPMTDKLRVDKRTGQTIGNTGSAQFFITVAPTVQLDDRHAIFGKCDPKVATEISKVRVQTRPGIDNRPFEDVTIKKIDIVRK